MRKILSACITSVLIGLCCKCDGQVAKKEFIWGINGHPLTQLAYTNNLDDQIYRLKDLNLKSYRFDVLLDSNGCAKKEELFLDLLKQLKANGIMPLPVLKQSGIKRLDNVSIYKKSFIQGQNFALRYQDYISTLEVNNEADNKMMLPGNLSGTKKKDYNIEKSEKIIAAIKGFTDGVKSTHPSINITLSVSYIHYYYLQLLKDNNVKYDIIGCHWYSNMGPIGAAKPNGDDVLAEFKRRFNKPIWVTEFNYAKGTGKASFAKQSEYLTESIPDMISRGVTGLFIYELYDQPALKTIDYNEAYYGLVFKDNFGKYVTKDAYQNFKQLIQNLGL